MTDTIKIKKRNMAFFLFWIALFCLGIAAVCPVTVRAEETAQRTIRVAFPVEEGMSYFHSDGSPDGYNYVYLEKIAEYTGWKIEYVRYDSGDATQDILDALADIKAGKVDLLGPMLKTSAQDPDLAYPQKSYGTVSTTLCALETSSLREDNAAALSPLRVGLLAQAETRNQEVISYLNTENFDYELSYYDSFEEQKQALADGEVDVISSVSLAPISGTRIIEKFSPRPYYFVSSKENQALIDELDQTITIVDQVQPSLQDVLFDRFFRNARYIFAPTEEQKEYLESLDTLQVLCLDGDAPYVYRREGKPAGMLVAVLNDFAEQAGVAMEYTFCESRSELESTLENGDYDLLIGLPFTSEYCTKIGFVRSKSIMESTIAYLHTADAENHGTVAVEKGLEQEVDTSDFDSLFVCENVEECIEAVKNGSADYAIGDRSALEYYIYDTYSSLVTSPISGETQNLCVAINRDSDLEFIRLINDYIYSLSDLQKTTFLEEGNTHVHHATLQSYVRLHPAQAVVVFSSLTGLVAVALFALFHARQMRKKNVELQHANEVKGEFLTRMSHDIRTPMNGIIGLLNISDRFLNEPEKVRMYHRKIRMASEYLLDLINDVLDMSKLDYGDVHLLQESVDLKEVLENCCDMLHEKAVESNITILAPDLETFDPPQVITSELHVRQVLMNLMSNAVKYNRPGGTVRLGAEVLSQEKNTVTCRFTVEDTGIGMSEAFQKKMFEPFSQEAGGARGELKGTGLGLSIVQRINEKLGGDLQVESQKGQGTCFTWTLTFAADPAQQEKQQTSAQAIDLRGKKILAAEDNALNAEILLFLLDDLGAETILVGNGKEAVETFRKSEPGEIDLILMDVMMPVMDGYTACRAIRNMNRPDAPVIPIIALTAQAFAEDAVKSAEAGMDAHLTKPLDEEKLKACMERLIRERELYRPSPRPKQGT